MPLSYRPIGFDAHALIKLRLNHMAKNSIGRLQRADHYHQVDIGPALPVYVLNLKRILAGEGMETSKHLAYCYYPKSGDGNAVRVEIRVGDSGLARINSISTGGTSIPAAIKALGELHAHKHILENTFEPRMFHLIPVLMGIWLKSPENGADFIYPYFRAPKPLELNYLYPADAFLGHFRLILKKRVLQNSYRRAHPKPPSSIA